MEFVYNKGMEMGENKNIQVVRAISEDDKVVIRAMQISQQVKILPYAEVEALLDKRVSKFLVARALACESK